MNRAEYKKLWKQMQAKYFAYIQSPEWKAKRRQVLKRDGWACRKCWTTLTYAKLEVHHLTYERLGNEDLRDLITLCEECHKETHVEKAAAKKVKAS